MTELLAAGYLNFFSLATFVLAAFGLSLAYFFLTVPGKTRATFHFGMAFLYLAIFYFYNCAAFTMFHPFLGYLRWIILLLTIPIAVHLIAFIIYFPDEQNPRIAKVIMILLYGIAAISTFMLLYHMLTTGVIYSFDGHYWDFMPGPLLNLGSIILSLTTLFMIPVFVWRIVTIKGEDRWWLGGIGVILLLASIISVLMNMFTRMGLMSREMYQIITEIQQIFGYALSALIYLNRMKERTTFMGKVIGISFVAFLVIFQVVNYVVMIQKEGSYDKLRQHEMKIAINGDESFPDIRYIASYYPETGQIRFLQGGGAFMPDLSQNKTEYLNMVLYEEMRELPERDYQVHLKSLLDRKGHPFFSGYKEAILRYADTLEAGQPDKAKLVLKYLDGFKRFLIYQKKKISEIPDKGFRDDLKSYLASTGDAFLPFREAITAHMQRSRQEGRTLKEDVLCFVAKMEPGGERGYRRSVDDKAHYVAFVSYDGKTKTVTEAGFDYTAYRRYVHETAKQLFMLIIASLVFFIVGFPLFFRGVLIQPLNELLGGVKRVMGGSLDVEVQPRTQDEIGILAGNFNQMVVQLKESRERVLKSEEKYRELSEQLPDIIYETDVNLNITYMNKAGLQITGCKQEDIVGGLSVQELVRQKEFTNLLNFWNNAIRGGENSFIAVHRLCGKTGGSIMGENNTSVIYDNQKPVGLRGVIRDVTEKLKTEEALLQAQKMETIGTLAGGLAHDFNNVLSGIIGTTSIMKYEMQAGKEASSDALIKRVETIEESGKRAADMVRQLLTLARKQEISFSPVDLSATISHVRKICENTFDKSIEIIADLPEEAPMVHADPTQIEQVLLNLCVNANHAMTIMRKEGERMGGRLHIYVEKIRADRHFRMTHPEAQDKDYWVISVSDTGVGMDSTTISKIFLPFFTTKDKGQGTGLGLSTVHSIVHQHGGFVTVYSAPCNGTTISVYIPAIEGAKPEERKTTTEPIPRGSGLILVVDDEETLRNLSRSILEKCGYEVITATNGLEGVEIFQDRHKDIHGVLMDLLMPKMSGEQAYLEMKKIDPQVKVLLTSGFRQDERVNFALSQGINGFIMKPFTLEKLAAAMEQLLQGQ